jgi:hypothetical protein
MLTAGKQIDRQRRVREQAGNRNREEDGYDRQWLGDRKSSYR